MKIIFLHMTMGLADRGSEISIDILATALAKKHKVLVIQSGPISHKSYAVKRVMPLAVAPIAAPSSIVQKIRSRIYMDDASLMVKRFTSASLSYIKAFNPDIIIATNGAPQLALLDKLYSRAKLVSFGRAGIGYHDRDNLRANPDLFIALSKKAELWAKDIASTKTKVVYIPNPISISAVNKVDLKLPSPVVMTVGALSKYKNIDKVIEAIRLTKSSLLLVGDGEERDRIGSALSNLPNDFRWIHHLGPQELAGYYNSADIFCFVPDPQESFGRVYLEAMWAGLPIVASDDPIRRSIVGEHGIYVDSHDIEGIARGINQAIGMGKVDYSKELKQYELKTVVSQIEKEFHDLIK